MDFLVGGLGKVLVPFTDGMEGFGGQQADDLVGHMPQGLAGFPGGNRNRHDDANGLELPEAVHGGEHSRTGGEAIVHHDDGLSGDGRSRPVPPVAPFPALELPAFDPGHVFHLRGRDAQPANKILAHHPDSAAGDRAHGELLVPGDPQLPHQQHVEGRAELAGNLVGHWNPAPRESEHHHVASAAESAELRGQMPTGFAAITKSRHGFPPSNRYGGPEAEAGLCSSSQVGSIVASGGRGVPSRQVSRQLEPCEEDSRDRG